MDLTVVVDGGGSGCRLAAFDANGIRCTVAHDGPASLTLGVEQAWQHINSGIASLRTQLGMPADWLPANLCMGLSGSLQKNRANKFLALIPESIDAILVTDGHAQLIGASNGEPAACLAIGTGSVLHWLDESGVSGMAGGWGFPMGDEGSGAWLGAQLINAYLWHRDTFAASNNTPKVFQYLEQRIGTSVSDIQVWSTKSNSTELASLAPMIIDSAGQGDALANSLIDQGVVLLQNLIRIAPASLPVYLIGGLAHIYQPRFDLPVQDRFRSPRGDALSGLFSISQNPGSGL